MSMDSFSGIFYDTGNCLCLSPLEIATLTSKGSISTRVWPNERTFETAA